MIFAKKGTKDRVCINQTSAPHLLMGMLAARFGGEWVYVDKVDSCDVICFKSSEDYLGYDGRADNNFSKPNLIKNFF